MLLQRSYADFPLVELPHGWQCAACKDDGAAEGALVMIWRGGSRRITFDLGGALHVFWCFFGVL
jgi:hypothetical protein